MQLNDWIRTASLLFLVGSAPALAEESAFPCFSPDERLIHKVIPGCEGESERFGRKVKMHYNSKGLRDRDYSSHPEKGILRILAIGPAYLVGPGLDQDKTPIESVKTEFGKLWKRPFEIINGATEGYFSIQSAIHLRELLDAYHPHLVVYFPMANPGFFYDEIMHEFVEYGTDGYPSRIRFEPTLRHAFQEQMRRFRLSWEMRQGTTEERLERFLGTTAKMMALMRDEAKRKGSKFAVFWRPSLITSSEKTTPDRFFWLSRIFRMLVPTVTVSGIDARQYVMSLDPMPRLLDITLFTSPENHFPGDFLLNENGSAKFGEEVGRLLHHTVSASLDGQRQR